MGSNAILASTRFLHLACENGFEMRFTRLDGGDTVNKVPDHAMTQFYLTSHQFEDFKRFFREMIRSEKKEKAFRVELGGVGDAGVRFLPDSLFPCLTEVVTFFQQVADELRGQTDDTYDPSFSTMNFGQLKQRMGSLDMHFDIRLLPDFSADELVKKVQAGVQAIAARYPNLNLGVVRERTNPSLNMSLEDPLLRICRESMAEAGIEPSFMKKATSTEAAQYFQAGYPAIVFGPGKSQGNSHSPNENNLLDQMEKAIDFYEKVIEKVCL